MNEKCPYYSIELEKHTKTQAKLCLDYLRINENITKQSQLEQQKRNTLIDTLKGHKKHVTNG